MKRWAFASNFMLAGVPMVMPTLALFSGASVTVTFLLLSLFLLLVGWESRDRGIHPWQTIPRHSWAFLALAVCWGLMSCLWTVTGTRQAIGSILSVAGLAGIGLLSIGAAASLTADRRRWIRQGLLAGIILAVLVLLNEIGFGYPLTRFFHNTNTAAAASILSRGCALLILMFWPAASILPRPHAVGLFLLLALAVAGTGKHAATLGFALAAITFVGGLWSSVWTLRAARGVALALVLSAPLIGQFLPPPETAGRAGLFNSALHRVVIWHFVTDHIAEHPWRGWGMDSSRSMPGGSDEILVQVKGESEPHSYSNLPLHPHNASLQIWLELGLPGALLLGGVLWGIGRVIRAHPHPPARIAALVAAITIASLSYGLWQSWWQSSLWITAVMFTIAAKTKEDMQVPLRNFRVRG